MHAPTTIALEFPRIQQELAGYAACQLGKELALRIQPLASIDLIRQAQQETTEAKALLGNGRSVPFGGIHDIRLLVQRAANGGVLRPDQLETVADTIYGCRQLHGFLTGHRHEAPLLTRRAEAFGHFDEAEAEIRRCIERGTVSSRASRALKQVRSEITMIEGRIQDKLTGILRQYRQHLQEALVTTRGGRYVVPVRASSRGAVPGTVHGASASGSTLFVEPEAIRHLCGELESWRAMEEAEIEQVLTALSGLVATHAEGLQATLGAVAELDLVIACARLSRAWDAQPVEWNDAGVVDLKGARHPLLGRSAIGNQIRMTPEARMLIITGPNTGGKTLLLKTLGLLVLIARCGLHIPVEQGSSLCLFAEVFADIGDHQSLEQSLSTFSGHIANVAPMLGQASSQTLVLLDELGSGTDPHEGTGLGIALLEALLQKGAYTLATTHLRELKEFARTMPGCAYAGMGFDGETLQPTYRLIYGTLGQSHGLEIAMRAGLPAAVVERARQLVYGAPAPPPAQAEAAQAPAPAPPAAAVSVRVPPDNAHGMVVGTISPGRCRVWYAGTERELTLSDSARRRLPTGLVVGDWVRVLHGQVAEVAQRRNFVVSRDADTQVETPVAANLTRMLIVASARKPDFHGSMLARHLFYAEHHGVTPVICLTKADLVADEVAAGYLAPFRALGYQAVTVSAVKDRALHELRVLLDGHCTAVIGYPGAGKTTLLAALNGQAEREAQGPRTGADRRRPPEPQAFRLNSDTWLVDLPGLRALGVWKPNVAGGFREFGPHAGRCSRPGCLHTREPGCAVRVAVEQGQLARARYEQYLHLLHHLRLA